MNTPVNPPLTEVLTAPLFDPGQGRFQLELPAGLTLLQIVQIALPQVAVGDHKHLRVILVSKQGTAVISRQYWRCSRPNAGVQVVIRLIPGKNILRAVLLAIVSVAAIAAGGWLAGLLIPAAGIGQTLLSIGIGAGLSVLGSLLVNALIPVAKPDNSAAGNVYSLAGWRNSVRRDEVIPLVLGKHRYNPPFAAVSYSEIVGDAQYIRAVFCFGYGALKLTDLKLGDTPIGDYDDVEIETREGREGDLPLALYPRQIVEDALGVVLPRPLPRDDAGELTGAPGIETPIKRFTATDTQAATVIVSFPGGLFSVDSKGRVRGNTVSLRIRQRDEFGGAWIDVETLEITASKREAFFRQYTWDVPSRARWEIEITRMTDESDSTQVSDRTMFAALQSMRPEYPINLDKPLALVSLRIKATHQLNGALDNFNAVVERYGQVYDASTNSWSEGLSRNPASAYLEALSGPANPFPAPAAEIDMELLGDWFDFCAAKGLNYDAVQDRDQTLGELLLAICAAGRATPRHDGIKWGVVIDRPQTLVVDHINPRNSAEFSWSRTYFKPPHGFRVTFFDETNDYNQAERLIAWPGHVGDITLTETLPLPGKTNPDEIWREARRRMYELIYRPDSFSVVQDGALRVATRGDLVAGSFDVLDQTQITARIKSVTGDLIELDEQVEMEASAEYGLRFRVFADPADTIGTSLVRPVRGLTGVTQVLTLQGSGALPTAGDLVHFGLITREDIELRVRGIEAGQDFSATLSLVAAAPEIDELLDAQTPPLWNGRVGAPVNLGVATVAVPRFTSVLHGASGTGDVDLIEVTLQPGSGSAAVVSTFVIEHRLAGAPSWTTISVPVANGGAEISGYSNGDAVDLRAYAALADATQSTPTPIISFTIGSSDALIPTALDSNAIQVAGGFGFAQITIGTTADAATKQVQIYRTPAGITLDRAVHQISSPQTSTPLASLIYLDGDGTRVNLLTNGTFDDTSDWSLGAGWGISGGVAAHSLGTSSYLTQTKTATEGMTYRVAYTVSGLSAGKINARLAGSVHIKGADRLTNGTFYDRLVAPASVTSFRFFVDAVGDANVDDASLFLETAACVDQGSYDYYFEPQNEDGVPGPVSGPFNTTIK